MEVPKIQGKQEREAETWSTENRWMDSIKIKKLCLLGDKKSQKKDIVRAAQEELKGQSLSFVSL